MGAFKQTPARVPADLKNSQAVGALRGGQGGTGRARGAEGVLPVRFVRPHFWTRLEGMNLARGWAEFTEVHGVWLLKAQPP